MRWSPTGYSGFQVMGDDRRILLGLKFSISGIFLFCFSFVWRNLSRDLSRDFFGHSKQSEDLW